MPFPSGEMLYLSAFCYCDRTSESNPFTGEKDLFGLQLQCFQSVVTVALQEAHSETKLLTF